MAVIINKEKCTGCGDCSRICPAVAIKIKANKAQINDSCKECCACVEQCSENAISYKF